MEREFEPGMRPPGYENEINFSGSDNEGALELAKVRLQQKLESAASELASAQARVDQLKEDDPSVDPEAARNLLSMRQAEFNALEEEWKQQYGPETTH